MKRRDLLRYGTEAAAVTAAGVGLVHFGTSRSAALALIRPPGALGGDQFGRQCIKCGRCIQVCPTDALGFAGFSDGLLRSGTPKLLPRAGGCIAWDEPCLRCIDVCPTGSLRPVVTDDRGCPTDEVIARAQIDANRCIDCGNCDPICPVDAVLPDGHGGRETYSVDVDACVGCGRCVEICPVDGKAIALFPPDVFPAYPIDMENKK